MVVGDTQQIEPLWGVSPAIDGGNVEQYKCQAEKPQMAAAGMLASEGSIMKMAQSATAFSLPGHEGMFLDEHWRCRRSTIAFCNDLAYQGKLTPMREDGAFPFPPLGYGHIVGQAERRGTSWANPIEAHVIALWLAKNEAVMQKEGRSLKGRSAIVTPFKAQISVLRKALDHYGFGPKDIVIGTIHALQGAERDIVILSPAYSADTARRLFFNLGVNMLNVAVSRAKESFLVFGDMRLFKADKPTPSGLLARHLFKTPDSEIFDLEPTLGMRVVQDGPESVKRIDTLDGHRQLLRRAIDEAQERVLIISPYLSINALAADGTPDRFCQAVKRGVQVTVCYDPEMNKGANGRIHQRAQAAIDALLQAGVTAQPVTPIHNKTLAVDLSWISEGSFNWLSASREEGGAFQRKETSMLYQGLKAAEFIEQAYSIVPTAK